MAISDSLKKLFIKVFGSANDRTVRELYPIVQQINSLENTIQALSDAELKGKTEEFRTRLQNSETLEKLLPEAFAVVRETAKRLLKMRHFDVQLLGGIVLHRSGIAEMVTGEGKTLVATLPAYLNALQGSVHIVTVNDYLARRDRDWMAPIFEFLGLTVGTIQSEMRPSERREEYSKNITYGTNNEFGFDYLRNNMRLTREENLNQRLDYAIIDEVDSILVDEARTPLIISGPAEESTQKYYQADKVASKLIKDVDYEVKEKEHSIMLTEQGIEKAEKLVGVDSFYTGKNMDWPHLLEQALRAHNLFHIDVDYVIEDNDVVIIDEFTGRKQPGRRWSDGLHQAIESKEKLRIREENQTLATITFQNFFRLYKKLAGMTGTAMTEAMEFHKIYKLEVVAIPTNRAMRRLNNNDRIYYDKKDKVNAIIEEIVRYHRTGRPILVGTISIENSELLSKLLSQAGVEHEVLNAKHHEREAQIVAKAGHMGNVTIATNMAGRGTDIVLGEFELSDLVEHWKRIGMAPKKASGKESKEELEEKLYPFWGSFFLGQALIEGKSTSEIRELLEKEWKTINHPPLILGTTVRELGGLHIVGTERHESRRIDNQLRGRCGRQGDPGSSRFFLSLEDDLMRIFANEWVSKMMRSAGLRDGQEIEHRMISNAIERAQKRVEGHNFEIRKNLLEYDEVMDKQRKVIYEQRESIIHRRDLRETVMGMIEGAVNNALDTYCSDEVHPREWELEEIVTFMEYRFFLKIKKEDLEKKSSQEMQEFLISEAEKAFQKKIDAMGKEAMDELMCFVLLHTIDAKWKDHLYAMDVLRSGIGLEGFGGKDPKLEYKRQALDMFEMMKDEIINNVTNFIFKLEFEEKLSSNLKGMGKVANVTHSEFQPKLEARQQPQQIATSAPVEPLKPIRRIEKKVGRNDPCSCGSGKKYKKCCGSMS